MLASSRHLPVRKAAALLALLALWWPGPAAADATAAFEPGALTIAFSPVYAYFIIDSSQEPVGGGAGLSLKYALSQSISVDLLGQWTGHDISPSEENPGGLYQIYHAALGLSYAFDVIHLSPVIEAGFGVLHHRYQAQSVTNLAFRFGLAVDYWFLEWLALGAALHYHAYLTNPTDYPVYFDAGPRISFRWLP